MSLATEHMDELSDEDREVLSVLAAGRANPYRIREVTGLDKGDTNTALVRLGRAGYAEQVTRGLYRITAKGLEEVGADEDDVDLGELREAVREAREAYEDVDGNGVDDAIARLEELVGVDDD